MKITFRPGQNGENKFKKPIDPPKKTSIDEVVEESTAEETPVQAVEPEQQPLEMEKEEKTEQIEQEQVEQAEQTEQTEPIQEHSLPQQAADDKQAKGKCYDDCYGKPGFPNYPGCPEPNCPVGPGGNNNQKCAPYPYPGFYYPLQCLGYPYIPWQKYLRTYTPREAFERGTLFPELWSPYFPDAKPPVIPRPYINYGQCMPKMRR